MLKTRDGIAFDIYLTLLKCAGVKVFSMCLKEESVKQFGEASYVLADKFLEEATRQDPNWDPERITASKSQIQVSVDGAFG